MIPRAALVYAGEFSINPVVFCPVPGRAVGSPGGRYTLGRTARLVSAKFLRFPGADSITSLARALEGHERLRQLFKLADLLSLPLARKPLGDGEHGLMVLRGRRSEGIAPPAHGSSPLCQASEVLNSPVWGAHPAHAPPRPADRRLRPLTELCPRLPSRFPATRPCRATPWRWTLQGLCRRVKSMAEGSGSIRGRRSPSTADRVRRVQPSPSGPWRRWFVSGIGQEGRPRTCLRSSPTGVRESRLLCGTRNAGGGNWRNWSGHASCRSIRGWIGSRQQGNGPVRARADPSNQQASLHVALRHELTTPLLRVRASHKSRLALRGYGSKQRLAWLTCTPAESCKSGSAARVPSRALADVHASRATSSRRTMRSWCRT